MCRDWCVRELGWAVKGKSLGRVVRLGRLSQCTECWSEWDYGFSSQQRSWCDLEVHPKPAPGDHSDGEGCWCSPISSLWKKSRRVEDTGCWPPLNFCFVSFPGTKTFLSPTLISPHPIPCDPHSCALSIPVPSGITYVTSTSLLILLEPCLKLPEGWDMCLGCWNFAPGLHTCLFFHGLQLFRALMCSITLIIAE